MRKILLSLLYLWLGFSAWSQDSHFTQYFSNPLYLNPAFTGSAGCSRIVANGRYQWPNISGNYKTAGISYDQYIHPMRSSLGGNLIYDVAGDIIINMNLNLLYSYKIVIKKSILLTPALNFGFGSRTVDYSALTFPDQIPSQYGYNFAPLEQRGKESKQYFNMGAGFLIAYENLVFGFAADHLNRPDIGIISNTRLPVKYIAHGSYQINFNESTSLTPVLIYARQKEFEEMLFSVSCKVWYIKAGPGIRFNFRNADSVFAMLGFQNKWMSIGYSYDYTISKLTHATGGSHEISMMFKFNCKNKTDKFPLPQIGGF